VSGTSSEYWSEARDAWRTAVVDAGPDAELDAGLNANHLFLERLALTGRA
jgi:hypothetical protein